MQGLIKCHVMWWQSNNSFSIYIETYHCLKLQYLENVQALWQVINPYPTAFPYGNGMVLHFYQQQESSTTKTVHKVINKGLKTYL